MRTQLLFGDLDASVEHTSPEFKIGCGQDMRYVAQFELTGGNGQPNICLEEAVTHEGRTLWTQVPSYVDDDGLFLMDKPLIAIRDSYFMGSHFRFIFLPSNNTTGTIYGHILEKTKV